MPILFPTFRATRLLAAIFILFLPCPLPPAAQAPAKKPAPEPKSPPAEFSAVLDLLETRVRFEADSASRKEIHAIARINTETGARQFAALHFDYNRAFEQIEIPLVRVTHAGGGTTDILPGAISDKSNPDFAGATLYSGLRRKSVRILGLAPGDLLEYRVVTTVSGHPLAPDFWLTHTFERSGLVREEKFTVDLPSARAVRLRTYPAAPAPAREESGEGAAARTMYTWRTGPSTAVAEESAVPRKPDIILSSFESWAAVRARLASVFQNRAAAVPEIAEKARSLTPDAPSDAARLEALYDFVAKKIKTLAVPLAATGFRPAAAADVLAAGAASPLDKVALFAALANSISLPVRPAFALPRGPVAQDDPPFPAAFTAILPAALEPGETIWLDVETQVAPFRMIPERLRGAPALVVDPALDLLWRTVPQELPFVSLQTVAVDAQIGMDGKLSAKIRYTLRGDNELLLRAAFHQTPRDRWKDVATMLSLSDGFRGQIASVDASDPLATRDPFTVEYEILQPKFVDWSRRPVRLPVPLPSLGLPEIPAKPKSGAAPPIDLGTPLTVETRCTLRLPAGAAAHLPANSKIDRDYASFSSVYSGKDAVVSAVRRLQFLLREIPAERIADYSAFVRAVQNDEAQDLALDPPPPVKP